MADNHTQISLRVPGQMLEEIDAAASEQIRSRTSFILNAVRRYMDGLEYVRKYEDSPTGQKGE